MYSTSLASNGTRVTQPRSPARPGWTMTDGSGKLVADLLAHHCPDITPEGLAMDRRRCPAPLWPAHCVDGASRSAR